MNVKNKKCPRCNIIALNEDDIRSIFGTRKAKSGNEIPQSYCKECRKKNKKPTNKIILGKSSKPKAEIIKPELKPTQNKSPIMRLYAVPEAKTGYDMDIVGIVWLSEYELKDMLKKIQNTGAIKIGVGVKEGYKL